ncbi:MAG TPA: AAA family ATPase, partial [Deinococcales bacterium]|nr:AAA family ATPase [Deinococcales bacterium]
MRIEQVTATAFGPLAGQTLHLAEGMTVVIGPNEAGKSTWHAAIFAALCGRRRGAGRPGEEAKFIDAYKPWEGSAWAVAARLVLDDGRRVEVRQDLANKVGSGATDLDLGIDLSNQIIFDGAPDAARWLGLDRKTFPSTASVRQAQLFSVLGGAEGLQEHLQRAAATAGTDATAAAALAAVTKFAAEHVGRNARNATKPWRVAEVAVETATRDLAAAQAAHRDYLARQEQVAAARAQAATATAVAECAAAAWARAQAEELAGRLDRARELAAQVGGVEPADASVDADLAGTVERALTRWSDRPADPDTDPDLAAVPAALATAQAQL